MFPFRQMPNRMTAFALHQGHEQKCGFPQVVIAALLGRVFSPSRAT